MSMYIEIIIACFIQIISCTYVFYKILNKDINVLNFKTFIIIVLMTILMCLPHIYDIGILKTIVMYIILVIGYKFIFKVSYNDSALINFLNIFLHFIGELIMGLIVVSLNFSAETVTNIFHHTWVSTFIILLIVFSIVKPFSKKLIKLKEILQKEKVSIIICWIIISLIIIVLFINININIKTWQDNNTFIISIIISLSFLLMVILWLREIKKRDIINANFEKIYEQSRSYSNILKTYKKTRHEYSNELKIIKSMLKDEPKASEYINLLLKDNSPKLNKYSNFITDLDKIPDITINSFLELKLNDMINQKINVFLRISNRIDKLSNINLTIKEYKDLFKVLGVFLDNAYEASVETKEKDVTIEINYKNNELILIISNTFNNVDINIEEIYQYGYSTKGENHGTGLSIVQDVISQSDFLTKKTEIIKNYFFQYLYIKLK